MKKLIAVLNKKVTPGQAMNALAHMTLGFSTVVPSEELDIIDYMDKDGSSHLASKMPFIILRGDNSNKIRTLREACVENNIPYTTFTQAMTIGTWKEQVELSKSTNESDLEYYGIVLLVSDDAVNHITKKFSLWQ